MEENKNLGIVLLRYYFSCNGLKEVQGKSPCLFCRDSRDKAVLYLIGGDRGGF